MKKGVGSTPTSNAMALEGGIPVIANPQFTLDMEEATKSREKLLDMKARTYYCYHGGVYYREY